MIMSERIFCRSERVRERNLVRMKVQEREKRKRDREILI